MQQAIDGVTNREPRLSSWLDYTINGLIVGNVYALRCGRPRPDLRRQPADQFRARLHLSRRRLCRLGGGGAAADAARPHRRLVATVAARWSASIIERFGLRPLQNSVRIAPLLATIGISFVLDQLVMLTFSPNPRALPSQLPDIRFQVGTGTIGPLDLLIAGVGITSALLLFVFLRYTKLGWAVRATAQDRDAAHADGRRRQPREPGRVRHRRRAGRPVRHAGRHVLQPDRHRDEPSGDAQGRGRGGRRRRRQCAGRGGRQSPAGAGGELWRRRVRHQLSQSVRVPAVDPRPGAAAERSVRQRAGRRRRSR